MKQAIHEVKQPLILVENERTEGGNYDHWQDATGERYHFPNTYKNKVLSGRRFIYYRGTRKADGSRRIPEYFGHGIIGEVFEDPSNNPDDGKGQRKWIATIAEYTPFTQPIEFKKKGAPYEQISQNRWGVAVRNISEQTYWEILEDAGSESSTPSEKNSLDSDQLSSTKPQVATAPLLVAKRLKENDTEKQIVSFSNYRRSKFSNHIGNRGEEIVLNYLKETLPGQESKTLKWNANEGETPGWDIQYLRADSTVVAIEVKSTTGQRFPSVELTANEWSAAERLASNYWLALVSKAMSDEPIIELINNPHGRLAKGEFQVKPSMWRLEMIQG